MAEAERWAPPDESGIRNDDDTAIKVVDDTVEAISQGHWKLFALQPRSKQTG